MKQKKELYYIGSYYIYYYYSHGTTKVLTGAGLWALGAATGNQQLQQTGHGYAGGGDTGERPGRLHHLPPGPDPGHHRSRHQPGAAVHQPPAVHVRADQRTECPEECQLLTQSPSSQCQEHHLVKQHLHLQLIFKHPFLFL